ncbi:MAG: alginate lyase family protein [Bryobacteraceae bacterium]|jgi:hypothetical protein
MLRLRWLAAGLFLAANVSAASRGYLTTPRELVRIRDIASAGVEPYGSAVRQLSDYVAHAELPPPAVGKVTCSASRAPAYAAWGAPVAYGFSLAFHITGDASYARRARSAILDLMRITGLEAGDCPLTMGRHIPSWIRAADLIEDYWNKEDKRAFQNWLARVIYPSLMTKYARGNNWGAVITNAGQYIADYCHDRGELKLGGRSPSEAYQLMRQTALDRINGVIWDQCGQGVSMIRPDGGIPEELRRSTTCDDTRIESGSPAHHYSEGYLAGTISQAELCLRRGDRSLYDNVNTSGGGSIQKAIDFVLDRVSWEKKPTLMIAARYYRDARMLAGARQASSRSAESYDYVNQFANLTHDFADGEKPAAPPVVRPPQ